MELSVILLSRRIYRDIIAHNCVFAFYFVVFFFQPVIIIQRLSLCLCLSPCLCFFEGSFAHSFSLSIFFSLSLENYIFTKRANTFLLLLLFFALEFWFAFFGAINVWWCTFSHKSPNNREMIARKWSNKHYEKKRNYFLSTRRWRRRGEKEVQNTFHMSSPIIMYVKWYTVEERIITENIFVAFRALAPSLHPFFCAIES